MLKGGHNQWYIHINLTATFDLEIKFMVEAFGPMLTTTDLSGEKN